MVGGLANILLELTSKTSKFLLKDYIELELLQSSNNKEQFLVKSLEKSKEYIDNFFATWADFEVVFAYKNYEVMDNDRSSICYFCPVDSVDNFLNALPYFAMVFFINKKRMYNKISRVCVIHFPILQESIYAVEGSGVFCVKGGSNKQVIRLKFSGVHSFKSESFPITAIEGVPDINTSDTFKANFNIQNARTFGSCAFSGYLVLRKKLSSALLFNIDFTVKEALKLLFQEMGGHCIEERDSLFIKSTFK